MSAQAPSGQPSLAEQIRAMPHGEQLRYAARLLDQAKALPDEAEKAQVIRVAMVVVGGVFAELEVVLAAAGIR